MHADFSGPLENGTGFRSGRGRSRGVHVAFKGAGGRFFRFDGGRLRSYAVSRCAGKGLSVQTERTFWPLAFSDGPERRKTGTGL